MVEKQATPQGRGKSLFEGLSAVENWKKSIVKPSPAGTVISLRPIGLMTSNAGINSRAAARVNTLYR